MSKKRFSNTERVGVNKVENIFLQEFDWIPRTLYQTDVGIDMTVEVSNEGVPTGQLIAIQIKSGESYFSEESNGNIIYRGTIDHLNYWLNHSLPVIIVLYNPNTDLTIWEEITEKKAIKTEKAWKIKIPKTNKLDSTKRRDLIKTNKLPAYLQRFQRLAVDKKLMEYINSSGILIVEVEEWVNKSSGKATIKTSKVLNGEDILISEIGYYHFSSVSDLQILFPWAEFEVDEDYYEEQEENDFIANYGIWDSEEKRYIGTFEDFGEHRARYPKIRPLEDPSGEIHYYRLFFSLNELGKSFLEVNSFMTYGKQLKILK